MANHFTQKAQNVLSRALECAKELGHTYIGSEHLLLGLAGEPDAISQKLLSSRGGDYKKIYQTVSDWTGVGVPTSLLLPNDMTPKIKNIIENSAAESLKNGQRYVGTEHMLWALLEENDCMAIRILSDLGISVDDLKTDIVDFLDSIHPQGRNSNLKSSKSLTKTNNTSLLPLYSRNLVLQAVEGTLDPVIGREKEIMRVIQILSRRTKNNPCLIGDPGVGKTAVIEGLAQLIADGNVPDDLKNKSIFTLDISSMIAGAKYRGEFEDRLKSIMQETQKNKDIILFIDEIHTIVGAGAAEGAIDAANIIKPALSRSELQIIGATTINEYRKYIEHDAALERRFQPVTVHEPSVNETVRILQGIKNKYETHHGLSISDEALEAAVTLSTRYITDRYLPDKAIDLIDEAAALKRLDIYAVPSPIVRAKERLDCLAGEKEEAIIAQDFETAAKLRDEELLLKEQLHESEKNLLRSNCETNITVTADDIRKIVTQWTGIPIGGTDNEVIPRLRTLKEKLQKRIIGQDTAIDVVINCLKRGLSGLGDPGRPLGTFLFCGKTGVGKTELAVALAEELFGDNNLIRLDMSEYIEKHSIAKLIGSPPGYVGYGDGGALTEAVRRRPYSVVLLDEIEKAHEDIFNLLLQLFDDGRLTDSQGKVVDFKNTIVIMTSNIGFNEIDSKKALGFYGDFENDTKSSQENMVDKSVKEMFRPEFINRIDEIVIFEQLKYKDILKITESMLMAVSDRAKKLNVDVEFSRAVSEFLAKEGTDTRYGARNLRRTIVNKIENLLSNMLIDQMITPYDSIYIDYDGYDIVVSLKNMPKE